MPRPSAQPFVPDPTVQAAAEAFTAASGVTARIQRPPARTHYTAKIEFRVSPGKSWSRPVLLAENVDRFATLAAIRATAHLRADQPFVVVAPHLSSAMLRHCRELGLDALDTSGNAVLHADGNLIMISGEKRTGLASRTKDRAWTAKGMKVVLALLCERELVNAGQRIIAQRAGVSLGTAQSTFRDLFERGDIVQRKDNYVLADSGRLLDEWAALYPSRLRNQLLVNRYRAEDPAWWRAIDPRSEQCRFGGEVAAALLTGYLKPATVTLYCQHDMPRKWLIDARLRLDPNGDVELLSAPLPLSGAIDAWQAASVPKVAPSVVHPALIYADLVATGDSRNLDIARMLREQYLAA
ncbi:type IV toxin-antitoxin system AbiEi family antitoxin [Paraburkholderia bryophila]|uniref:type IV toxin-antitoxin system AbiEi family antitoxin n=1 Tax=Paraburkholderia bryophila TaxID=420952 RepID=UPI00234ABDDF|nr:type IV toxin-antitoxin system AbiEi family antitoxin [Paraburkholderia bryophila]WCM21637.1 type IV toxin-antitoxin system AbiEi family antitoxin [Paraburkholderia bryophila]